MNERNVTNLMFESNKIPQITFFKAKTMTFSFQIIVILHILSSVNNSSSVFAANQVPQMSMYTLQLLVPISSFFSRSLKTFILCSLCRRVGHQAGGHGRSEGASYCHASCLRGDGANRGNTGRRWSVCQTCLSAHLHRWVYFGASKLI